MIVSVNGSVMPAGMLLVSATSDAPSLKATVKGLLGALWAGIAVNSRHPNVAAAVESTLPRRLGVMWVTTPLTSLSRVRPEI